MSYRENISNKIKERLKELNMYQKDFAEAVGVGKLNDLKEMAFFRAIMKLVRTTNDF